MELFKFSYTTDPTVLEQGQVINGSTSIMWAERYSEPGEFEIETPLSSGLREFLPLGTLISHVDTLEVMIVENHEIKEKTKLDPTLVISGRSFDTILEQRFVGVNQARASSTYTDYNLPANYTWIQAVALINDHIANATNVNDNFVNVAASTLVPGTGISEARILKIGSVYNAMQELLAIDNCGIRTIRRNPFGITPGDSTQTILLIYKGTDKSGSVIFSWKAGELDSAQYLFSNKKLKNSALVVGRYVVTMVDTGPIKYNRRIMVVDADDIDGDLTAPPSGATLTAVISAMQVRGRQALESQNTVTLSRTDLSRTTRYQYRRDYDLGDLVSLDGNFGVTTTMRVVEYVEIEDENGESGHPTLALPG